MWQVVWRTASQTVDPSALNLTQLGVASIVVVILLFGLRYLLAQNVKKDLVIEGLNSRIDALQELRIKDRDAQMERDRERSERVIALLQQTATVLEATPRSLERALGTARDARPRADVDDTLRQVREMVAEVERRWKTGPENI